MRLFIYIFPLLFLAIISRLGDLLYSLDTHEKRLIRNLENVSKKLTNCQHAVAFNGIYTYICILLYNKIKL